MSPHLTLSPSAGAFPYGPALAAKHLGVDIQWSADGSVKYGSASGVEAVEQAVYEQFKGKGNPLPPLPGSFDAKTAFPQVQEIFNGIDNHLALRTFLAGRSLGQADFHFMGLIKASPVAVGLVKRGPYQHLGRWYAFIEGHPLTGELYKALMEAKANEVRQAKQKQSSGSIETELKGAQMGKVVVRFAPEPSGYLHIGHIKAAILNRYLADKYQGKFLLRFDDTNPEKEEDEFEDSFKGDLELLGLSWDKVVHTSDWFDKIQELARKMVEKGKAFMDDTDQMTMREQRLALIPSKHRDASIEENLARFDEMITGSAEGSRWFLRAKMDYQSPNGAMRDPAIYRCINKPHHVTGDKYKAYPTYDLACPIVDSLDGVTHALRANEYADRKPQYEWFLKALDLPHVEIFDFSRLDFVYTLLSKRKLKYLVENGHVGGWEDPRFATIRGIRARGMTFEALKSFIAGQGASSGSMLAEWDGIWSHNKKVIDPIAPRYWAIAEEDMVKVHVRDGPTEQEVRELPAHKKNPEVGKKQTIFGSDLLMEQVDAASFGDNEEITVMDWGNAFVREKKTDGSGKVTDVELELHLEGDFKKTSKKVHWLTQPYKTHDMVPVVLIEYDYLINKKKIEDGDDFTACLNPVTEYRTKAIADANVLKLQKNDIIQFERKGFHIYQGTKDAEGRMQFGFIPDGRLPSVALRGKPYEEPAAGEARLKGWGKTAGVKEGVVPPGEESNAQPPHAGAQSGVQSGVELSDTTRGFPLPSSDKMYKVDRVYGREEVLTPADSVKMFATKPIYSPE